MRPPATGLLARIAGRVTPAVSTVVLLTAVAACGRADDPGRTGVTPAQTRALTVFAAASLSEVFAQIGEDFEREHGTPIEFSFAGSSDLVSQLAAGAPADVFASADETNMGTAIEANVVATDAPVLFATNTLILATAPGNPEHLGEPADLTRPGLSVVVCAPQVPCGAATHRLLAAAGVGLTPVSEESSVTDVLGKVSSGQADAGFVYVTDAIRAGDAVSTVEVPEAVGIVNSYPIAVTTAANSEARTFVDYVTGPGQAVLAEAGFGPPPQ